jgi:hypothetical protein
MMRVDKYREELLFALRLYDISGRRCGDVLAEVEAHVAETGEDPVDAFGTPREYAAEVGAQLDPSTRKPSTLRNVAIVLRAGAPMFLGYTFLLDGLSPDERGDIVVTLADAVGWSAFLVVVVAASLVIARAVTATAKRTAWALAGGALYAAAVLGLVAPGWVIDERALLAIPDWASVALGAALLAVAVASLRRGMRRGRVVDPRSGRAVWSWSRYER